MSVTRNRTPRMAALLLSIAVGGTFLTTTTADAAPQATSVVQRATTSAETVVSRLSTSTGPAAGGNKVLVQGTKLATVNTDPDTAEETPFLAKEVKVGYFKKSVWTGVTLDEDKVTALTTGALEIVVPAWTDATLAVQVLVGDATKGPKYTYVSAAPTVSTTQSALSAWAPSSESGLKNDDDHVVKIAGSGFDSKLSSVMVGGKKVKATLNEAKTEFTFDLPAGLVGAQDVVLSDKRGSTYVGYVIYTAVQPSLEEDQEFGSALNEAATTIRISGTDLNQLASGTFTYTGQTKAEKVSIKAVKNSDKTTDTTHVDVTVPKAPKGVTGSQAGTVTLTTKYGNTVSFAITRAPAATPTVTAVTLPADPTKGGVATLTGTNLVGLKTVTLTDADDKVLKGTSIKVLSSTSANVTLPKLTDGATYTLTVTTLAASTGSKSFTVGEVAAPAPTVSAVTSADGETVAITGTNLTGATTVTIDGTAVTTGITVNSATSVTVVLSAPLAAGTYPVTVTTPGGTSTAVNLTVEEETP